MNNHPKFRELIAAIRNMKQISNENGVNMYFYGPEEAKSFVELPSLKALVSIGEKITTYHYGGDTYMAKCEIEGIQFFVERLSSANLKEYNIPYDDEDRIAKQFNAIFGGGR